VRLDLDAPRLEADKSMRERTCEHGNRRYPRNVTCLCRRRAE
jgi:hypothetical protein